MGRYAHLEATEMEIQKKLDKNLDARETNRVARYAVQRDLLERNRERVQAGRLQSETNLRQKTRREMDELGENRRRWEEVKKGKEDSKSRQAALRASKHNSHRETYERKIAREDEMKAQTETLIQRMEREEMELIQRLQNTHSVQQSAMAELENTIASAAGPRGNVSKSKLQEWSPKDAYLVHDEPVPQ